MSTTEQYRRFDRVIQRSDSIRHGVHFERGAANLRLTTTSHPDVLVAAASTNHRVHVTTTGDRVLIRYPRHLLGWRRPTVEVCVNEVGVRIVQFDKGATNVDGDLRDATLDAIRFRSGASRVHLYLPIARPVWVEFMRGADRVTLVRPHDTDIRFQFERGVADVDVDGTLRHAARNALIETGHHGDLAHSVVFHGGANRVVTATPNAYGPLRA